MVDLYIFIVIEDYDNVYINVGDVLNFEKIRDDIFKEIVNLLEGKKVYDDISFQEI